MQEVSIISYNMNKCNLAQRTLIQRTINGFKDYSNNKSYVYIRKGIIDIIPNIYLNNGVIIVKSIDAKKITKILKKTNASIKLIKLYSKKPILH